MKRLHIILLLALGHGVTDMYPGLLSPFLPIFTDRYGWSITRAGILVTVLQLASNLSQPFFAVFNDHRPTRSIMWMGLLISGLPFCFMLSVDNFPVVAAMLAVCGIGVGMYHPPGVTAAGRIALGKRSGSLLGIFSAGGLIGFTVAPLIAVLFIEVTGERYLPLVLLPAILTAAMIALDRDIPLPKGHGYTIREWFASLFSSGRRLVILWLVSSFRNTVALLVGSFLPMLLLARGFSYAESALLLSAQFIASIFGMLAGGYLSDIHGHRKILAVTLLMTTPLLYGFLHTSGVPSLVFLFIGMGVLSSTIPVTILLAQEAAPNLASTASSMVMGLSFALGALLATPFGMLADRVGIETAMNVPLVLPFLGGIIIFLKKSR